MALTTEELIARINANHRELVGHQETNQLTLTGVSGRLQALEQRVATIGEGGGGSARARSWGAVVTASDAYRQFTSSMGGRGRIRIPIRGEITVPSGTETLAHPMRDPEIVGLSRPALTVRRLLAPGRTGTDNVQYLRQIDRTNAAAPVAPGNLKPESDMGFEVQDARVKTIATWIPATVQMVSDVEGLQSFIDSELRYMLGEIEEQQLLAGDGVGENLLGLIPQATPFSPPFSVTGQQELDMVLLAIAQLAATGYAADGVVLSNVTWARLLGLKDNEGRYYSNGPFATLPGLIWNVPVVPTPSLEPDEFLVGAFRLAGQIFDRQEPTVEISTEDRDNFIRNMVTIRAEERLALAIKRPSALVYGTFDAVSS